MQSCLVDRRIGGNNSLLRAGEVLEVLEVSMMQCSIDSNVISRTLLIF